MAEYEPELSQLIFGQPYKSYLVPEIMDAVLRAISDDLDRAMWNINQTEYASPFNNTGATFRCKTFTAVSYSWSDEPQPYNFKHPETGLLISWYKWSGRGASSNIEITPDLASKVLESCLAAVRRIDDREEEFDEPGQYPDGQLSGSCFDPAPSTTEGEQS